MKRNGRKLLFEMMEKVNPEFRQVDEISADAATTQKAMTPLNQRTNSRIDNPQDFKDWFQIQFSTTGFDPKERPISIGQVQGLVRDAMIALGYK